MMMLTSRQILERELGHKLPREIKDAHGMLMQLREIRSLPITYNGND